MAWQPWRPAQGLDNYRTVQAALTQSSQGRQERVAGHRRGNRGDCQKGNAKAFCAIRDTVDGPPKQESQDNSAKVLIQFTRDPPTPAIQVASKPNF